MSFSFNPAQIAASGGEYISATRFLLADTTEPSEVSDEMITALYDATSTAASQASRVYETACAAAQYLATLYAKQATFSSGGTSVQLGERADQWAKRASDLQYLMLSQSGGVIYMRRGRECYGE